MIRPCACSRDIRGRKRDETRTHFYPPPFTTIVEGDLQFFFFHTKYEKIDTAKSVATLVDSWIATKHETQPKISPIVNIYRYNATLSLVAYSDFENSVCTLYLVFVENTGRHCVLTDEKHSLDLSIIAATF